MICSITSKGFETPPVQKESHILSILLLISPVINFVLRCVLTFLGFFWIVMGKAALFRNLSRSLRLNSQYPFAGFRCIGMSPRAAHLRIVFWATPRYSAAAGVWVFGQFGHRRVFYCECINTALRLVYQTLLSSDSRRKTASKL